MEKNAPPSDLEQRRETELVHRAASGDEDAFQALVEAHSAALFRLAWRFTGSAESADDVVQETFLRAWRSLRRFDSRSRFSTWLHRIAANAATDLLRRQQRHVDGREELDNESHAEPFIEDAPGPERLTLSTEIEHRVDRALGQLTAIERTAFVLRHFEERSIADIGRILGSRTSATKQAVFRAVHKLRRELAPWIEENDAQIA
jgi:RNA polymerase sigma-70 factor (ECF subfamily)